MTVASTVFTKIVFENCPVDYTLWCELNALIIAVLCAKSFAQCAVLCCAVCRAFSSVLYCMLSGSTYHKQQDEKKHVVWIYLLNPYLLYKYIKQKFALTCMRHCKFWVWIIFSFHSRNKYPRILFHLSLEVVAPVLVPKAWYFSTVLRRCLVPITADWYWRIA